jgi:hypothetical protein
MRTQRLSFNTDAFFFSHGYSYPKQYAAICN